MLQDGPTLVIHMTRRENPALNYSAIARIRGKKLCNCHATNVAKYIKKIGGYHYYYYYYYNINDNNNNNNNV